MADHEFDGHPITDRKVKITKAGDGLSEALKLGLESGDLKAGDTVELVLRGVVGGAQFKPAKAGDLDGDYVRIDNIEAGTIKIVSSADVANILDEHEAAVTEARAAAKEAAEGIKRLAFDDATDQEQQAEDGVTATDATVTPIGGDDWDDEPQDDDGGDDDGE